MNYRSINTLTIEGTTLCGMELLNFCNSSSRPEIQQAGGFLQEWLNDNDFLELKTSGSTGEPKAMLVEKNQMLESAAMTAAYFEFQQNQSALLCLPVQYIAGKMMIVRAMLSGLNLLCVTPSGDPLALLPGNLSIDFAPLLPMQLNSTAKVDIKKILLGGAAIDLGLEKKLQNFPSEIFHGYGMTETLSHVAIRNVNGPNRSDLYKALKGITFEIDARGCLIVNAPFLAQPVITNDAVALMSTTSFRWKGRIDFIVNSGGIKLFPEEIERKIADVIPGLFFMAGIPDERFGEKLCLFIEKSQAIGPNFDAMEATLLTYLDKFEMPRQIFYLDRFVTTSSGKINRVATINLLSTLRGAS